MLPIRAEFNSDSRFRPQAKALVWGADPYALQSHMNRCRQSHTPWFSVGRIVAELGSFLAPRSFTSFVVVAIVARVTSLVL